jgi:hypothetical protein
MSLESRRPILVFGLDQQATAELRGHSLQAAVVAVVDLLLVELDLIQ